MGVVYEAEQISARPSSGAQDAAPACRADRPRMLERFRREARAAASNCITPISCRCSRWVAKGKSATTPCNSSRARRSTLSTRRSAGCGAGRRTLEGRVPVGQDVSRMVSGPTRRPTRLTSPTGSGRSGVGQVVNRSCPGGSGSALVWRCKRVLRPELERTMHEASVPARGLVHRRSLPEPRSRPSELRLRRARDRRRRRFRLPVSSGSSLTSAVLPGGTRISSIEVSGSRYARSVLRIGLQASLRTGYAHAGAWYRDIKPSTCCSTPTASSGSPTLGWPSQTTAA